MAFGDSSQMRICSCRVDSANTRHPAGVATPLLLPPDQWLSAVVARMACVDPPGVGGVEGEVSGVEGVGFLADGDYVGVIEVDRLENAEGRWTAGLVAGSEGGDFGMVAVLGDVVAVGEYGDAGVDLVVGVFGADAEAGAFWVASVEPVSSAYRCCGGGGVGGDEEAGLLDGVGVRDGEEAGWADLMLVVAPLVDVA